VLVGLERRWTIDDEGEIRLRRGIGFGRVRIISILVTAVVFLSRGVGYPTVSGRLGYPRSATGYDGGSGIVVVVRRSASSTRSEKDGTRWLPYASITTRIVFLEGATFFPRPFLPIPPS
jgi:hypothetical protein